MTWRVEKLSRLCCIQSGGTPRRGIDGYYGGDIPWAKICDLGPPDGIVTTTEEAITAKGLAAIRGRLFPAGSLLLAMYGSIGKIARAGLPISCNQAILGIQVKRPDVLNINYLHRWLKSIQPQLEMAARGVTQKNISATIVRSLEIPLPPLPEQKRIASILDKADAIRRKRQESIRLADAFLRSAFLDMFGDPVTNPKGWPRQVLGDLLDRVESGWSPICEDRHATSDEWSVLKLSAVTSCVYLDEENKALLPKEHPRPDIEVKCGDLLFSRKNTYELVAACALVNQTAGKRMLSDLIFRLRIRKGAPLVPEYLWGLLTTKSKRRSVQTLAGGSSGSMPNISKEKLRTVMVELPPANEQQTYAALLRRARDTISQGEAAGADADMLFQALSHRAFRGELL